MILLLFSWICFGSFEKEYNNNQIDESKTKYKKTDYNDSRCFTPPSLGKMFFYLSLLFQVGESHSLSYAANNCGDSTSSILPKNLGISYDNYGHKIWPPGNPRSNRRLNVYLPDDRVIADQSRYPDSSVGLVRFSAGRGYYHCTGTLVAPQWILTNGHCVASKITNSNQREITQHSLYLQNLNLLP